MYTSLYEFSENKWIKNSISHDFDESKANLVLCFASKTLLESNELYKQVKEKFQNAEIAICSTSGEIYHDKVQDESIIVTALYFEKSTIKSAAVNIKNFNNSYLAAINLAKNIDKKDLVSILLLSDGSLVNGSEIVKGISTQIDKKVLITGGMAGDGDNFKSTLIGLNSKPIEGEIIAICFYGENFKVKHGTQGGWDIFGLEKTVTNSSSNVLFELEGQNALDLYKKYLGDESKKLPGSALLFPLSVIIPGATKPVVRTILSINEEDKTMTFAGDIPVGSKVKFMKANFDKLTMAASTAANHSLIDESQMPGFSLLISCVGRKLILGSRIDDEIKAVSKTFDDKTILAGFYSYGEIAPFNEGGSCQLHNQTITITSFYEN